MRVFGNKSKFATEFGWDDDQFLARPRFSFTYWIGGQIVGCPELDATPLFIRTELRDLLADLGHRENKELYCLKSDEIINKIQEGFFDASSNVDNGSPQWRAHAITCLGSHGYEAKMYQSWAVYIVEGGSSARVIYYIFGDFTTIAEQIVDAGYVDAVLTATWYEIMVLYELE